MDTKMLQELYVCIGPTPKTTFVLLNIIAFYIPEYEIFLNISRVHDYKNLGKPITNFKYDMKSLHSAIS